jgi:hypothetical protein
MGFNPVQLLVVPRVLAATSVALLLSSVVLMRRKRPPTHRRLGPCSRKLLSYSTFTLQAEVRTLAAQG